MYVFIIWEGLDKFYFISIQHFEIHRRSMMVFSFNADINKCKLSYMITIQLNIVNVSVVGKYYL